MGVLALFVAAAGVAAAQGAKPPAKSAERWPVFGHNLLRNGTIEAPGPNPLDPTKVSGWSDAEGLQQAAYGTVAGEWEPGVPGCLGCGKQYLRLQFGNEVFDLMTSQTVDVAQEAEEIDAGKVTAHPSAWLGGFRDADTTSTLELRFQDASGKILGSLSTDPLDSHALTSQGALDAAMTLCETKGKVPAGTRKILFTWHAMAVGTSERYIALGDNFSLMLTAAN